MQLNDRIRRIERRARRLRLTLPVLCRAADVPYCTLWRWRTRKAAPRVGRVDLYLGKLEAELASQERTMRRRLAA